MLSGDLQGRAMSPVVLYVNVFPFRVEEGQHRYLIFQRSVSVVMPLIWQPVCGKLTAGASIREAFIHQVRKKAGVEPAEIVPIDYLISYYDHHYDCVMMVPCVGARLPPGQIMPDTNLYAQARWVSYDDVPKYIAFNGQLRAFEVLNASLTEVSSLHSAPV